MMRSALAFAALVGLALSAPVKDPVPEIKRDSLDFSFCKFDIAFLLDASESMSQPKFAAQTDAVMGFLEKATVIGPLQTNPIFPEGIEVALFRSAYQDNVLVADFNQGSSKPKVQALLKSLSSYPAKGLSAIYEGMNLVAQSAFTPQSHHRTGVKKVLVVVTDGQNTAIGGRLNATQLTLEAAQSLEASGVTVITIQSKGWGKAKPEDAVLLKAMASQPNFAVEAADLSPIFADRTEENPYLSLQEKVCNFK